MATKNLTIAASYLARARSSSTRRSVLAVDPGQVSVTNTALVPPDHVIRKGFPHIPKFRVTSSVYLSADGSYVPELTYPYEAVFQGEHSRFIAQENLWDDIADVWTPLSSVGVDYYFAWSGTTQPVLEDVEYRIGKMLYPMNSAHVTPGSALVSSFNAGMDDAASFSIAMAGVINSSERASLLRVGDTMGTAIEVSVDESFYLRNQYGTAALQPTAHPAKMIPFYLVLTNDAGRTELAVASGMQRISKIQIPNQDFTRSLKVFIGKDLAGNSTLDANIFEFTLFPYGFDGPMSTQEIIEAMADVYGSAA